MTFAVLPTLSETLILASAGSAAVGWRMIRKRNVRAHRAFMWTAVAFATAFFLTYALKTLILGDATFGGPVRLRPLYDAILAIHIACATVAAGLGVITLRRALRRQFAAHRRLAPWTVRLWWTAAASGLLVYVLLYVVFSPGPFLAIR